MKGTLYLVPVTLGTAEFRHVLPENVISIIKRLRNFIVEDIRTARRFLRAIDPEFPIDESEFVLLNEHTPQDEHFRFLGSLNKGLDTGLMSEAGVPGVADPGSPIIFLAHKLDLRVVPLTGPSSILLAMMASGLNGQNFAFNGYLPVKSNERIAMIKRLEQLALLGQSQMFMEAPYRNQKLLSDILMYCRDETLLSVAVDLTSVNEYIKTLPVRDWKKKLPEINKKPAMFILGCC